jgi:hypothetical protein
VYFSVFAPLFYHVDRALCGLVLSDAITCSSPAWFGKKLLLVLPPRHQ